MKNKIVFIIGVLFAVKVVYSIGQYCPVPNKNGGYIHNGLNSANSRSSVDDGEKLVWKEGNILKQMENERQLKNQCKKLKDNIAKTDADEARAMGDKCDVIKAIEQLISCMKERNAAVDSVSRRLPKKSMSDIRSILSDGDAISAESARYAERVEKCIETLNVSFLKMEKEFSNDSTVQINAIREKRYNSIKQHIIELFEILRDSPDKIRHRVENVIPIRLARYLVNCDNRIRKKYYLLPSFGFEL